MNKKGTRFVDSPKAVMQMKWPGPAHNDPYKNENRVTLGARRGYK
jgi:hypothetical protein